MPIIDDPEELMDLELQVAPKGGGKSVAPVPMDLAAERKRRLDLQAATGSPVLRLEADPNFGPDGSYDPMTRRANVRAGVKETGVSREAIAKAREGTVAARRIGELNSKMKTGGLMGWLKSTPLGATLLNDPDVSTMNQLSLNVARNSRVPGEGAISDYDARQFKQMAPGVDKPNETNQTWAAAAMEAEKRAIEYGNFKQSFLATNGTLDGMDELWQQYADSNRIFMDNGKLNPNRKGWRQFFQERAQRVQRGQPASGGGKFTVTEIK